MRLRIYPLMLVLLAPIFANCGDSAQLSGSQIGPGPADTESASDESGEEGQGDVEGSVGDSTDVEPNLDAVSDLEGDLLEVGETCFADAECDSSLCLFFEAGIDEGICSWFCADEDQCPDEYDCIFVRTTGSDIAKLCVPETLCIDHDSDDYGAGPGCLGRDCDDENELINPGQFELCDGFDNDCDGTSDVMSSDVGQSCDTGNPGICSPGRTHCDPNRGALFCIPDQPAGVEVCDGADNDCDGLTDEDDAGDPIAMSCYYGAAGTEGLGLCVAGRRICNDGFFGDCLDSVIPSPELCDGFDNNCNDEIDEGNPQEGVRCETGLEGVCGIGLTNCPVEGELECVGVQAPGELDETCNLQDDDCDGLTDEDDDDEPLTRDCYYGPEGTLDEDEEEGVRMCRRGVETCDEGLFRVCEGQVLPSVELCNGLDDDCDGIVDNDPIDVGTTCETDLEGVCGVGLIGCRFGADEPRECTPLHDPFELEEVCNGMDDDCDGHTDEDGDDEPLTQSCYFGPPDTLDEGEGVRVCRAGIATCDDGFFTGCVGQVLPSAELCNGIDDDCDGIVDNDPTDAGLTCSTGLDGVCATGVSVCTDDPDEPLVCVAAYVPDELVEECNRLDDDCDGSTDEDEDGELLSQSCYFGSADTLDGDGVPRGICRAGTATCDDGVYQGCQGQTLATVETCNRLDDDCDGNLDNAPIDAGLACSTGEHGVCAAGLTVCTLDPEEPLVCVAAYAQFELEEECNLLDDDCDGFTDEGADEEPLERSCYYGPENTLGGVRVCTAGIEVCTDGFYQACEGQVLPSAETCNGFDDNCNNVVDDQPIDVGTSCDTGHPGVCKLGTTACVDAEDPIACVPPYVPFQLPESCNGFDDDCDGFTDEDADGDPLARPCYDGGEHTLNPLFTERRCQMGVQTCDGGDYASCVGQLLPIPEICNDVDDDCDGELNEDNPGGGVQCDTGLDGVCAAGVTSCEEGTIECNQLVESSDEVCDGFDNNCNGEPDEGNPGANQACATGEDGICNEGVTSCDGGRLLCNRTHAPLESEVCNLLDDTCDGNVDEGFQTDGVYGQAQWCGNCFTNCLTIFAKDNAHGECNTEGESPACEMICETGFFDLNNVPDDGCEFELETDVIYVSPLGIVGDDCGLGPEDTVAEENEPCQAIEAGLARAVEEERSAVHVADGEYDEAVVLEAGIDLLGGYRADTWERHLESTGTAIRGPQGTGHRRAVTAENISEATVFEGFTIYAANATTLGTNSYGIYVRNSNNQLTIRKNNVIAGMGGPGQDGTDGISGQNGLPGGDGDDTSNISSCTIGELLTARAGEIQEKDCADPETRVIDEDFNYTDAGAGGAPACPSAGVQSGGGGNGMGHTTSAPFWGLGGDGGWGHYIDGSCWTSGSTVLEVGLPGYPGRPAVDGPGGDGCQPNEVLGRVVGDDWVGYSGLVGDHGTHGRGGGGGGSGGGDYLVSAGTFDISGGGGAGGSGGCAGQRGQPGNPGGGSFGIFVLLSPSADSVTDIPRITGNSVVRNYGGNGGDGGIGGTGGEGGAAGRGGEVVSGTYDGPAFCIFPGAPGGVGSRGGHAGGGGGACGGVSADIAIFNRNGIDHSTQVSGNTFPIANSEPTGGSFGSGGNSSNPDLGEGDNGLSGSYGNILTAD